MDDVTAAEQVVLGSALASGGASIADCPLLAVDFYRPPHAELWSLLLAMNSDAIPIDPVSVLNRLGEKPVKGIDGPYLHTLYAAVPVTANANYHAQIVREHADLRAIAAAGQKMTQSTSIGEADAAKSHARQILDSLDRRDVGTSTQVLGEAVIDVIASIESGTAPGLSTPWTDLDALLGGLRPGGLYVVGARPGLGKSILGLQLAWHVAIHHGPALLHSLEMPTGELVRRLLSAVSQVAFTSIARSTVGELEWDRIEKHIRGITETPLFIDDRASIRTDEIAASARKRSRDGLALLVVDYLQLVSPNDRKVPREQQVAEASRSLKLLAKDLSVPVVVLAQLNRQSELRAHKRPNLSDLRESGAVEQDADAVLLLYRDENEPEVLEVGVGKNRQGPQGVVKLHWDAKHMRVTNLARAWGAA